MANDLATGLISIVLGTTYLYLTFRLPDVSIGDPIGPKLFPMLVGAGAVFCGTLLTLHVIRANRTGRGDRMAVDLTSKKGLYGKIGLTILAGVIYSFLLDPVGYLISTFVFMTALMCLVNTLRRAAENVIIALGFSVTTYLVFARLFQVSLPRGILAF
ncbi:MAG: tripartite tricarboxylate transporter TctB family protein [Firmicutes bacterium]|nr:tripartite tricarboxylate transporter TctB family protein [Bacillota bacterium]